MQRVLCDIRGAQIGMHAPDNSDYQYLTNENPILVVHAWSKPKLKRYDLGDDASPIWTPSCKKQTTGSRRISGPESYHFSAAHDCASKKDNGH